MCLETGIPSVPDLQDEATINTYVKSLTTAISKALANSTPKRRQGRDPRPSIRTRIQDEIRMKPRLRRQGQAISDTALKAEVNRLQTSVTNQLDDCRKDQWSNTLVSLYREDRSLWKMTRRVINIPPRHPLVVGRSCSLGLREI
jgi:hypothetical protein